MERVPCVDPACTALAEPGREFCRTHEPRVRAVGSGEGAAAAQAEPAPDGSLRWGRVTGAWAAAAVALVWSALSVSRWVIVEVFRAPSGDYAPPDPLHPRAHYWWISPELVLTAVLYMLPWLLCTPGTLWLAWTAVTRSAGRARLWAGIGVALPVLAVAYTILHLSSFVQMELH